MATIDDIKGKLDQLTGIKADIKEAIISKGQSVGDNMTEYAYAIKNISSVKPNYLTFTADTESSVYLQNNGSNSPNCEYSFNGVDWITIPTTDTDKVTIPVGEKIFVRGNNPSGFSTGYSNYSEFVMTGSISASGSVMSLIDGTGDTTTIPCNFCFAYLFSSCNSLITAPELPAMNLTAWCYISMFGNCTALTIAPELPATTLASSCYSGMFMYCETLTAAPELPATTLVSSCYSYMFQNCTALTTAPELPAATLETNCYSYMFQGCSSLNYIKCLATDVSGDGYANWVTDVSSAGTFVQEAGASWPSGGNGIPSGWIVKYNEVEPAYSSVKVSAGETVSVNPPEGKLLERVSITFKNKPSYLTFTADTESSVYLQNNGSNSPNCEYSFNGTDWITMPTADADKVAIPAGESIFVRGNNPSGFSVRSSKYSGFVMTGSISASGSVMSLIDRTGETTTIPSNFCFYSMFYNCTALTVAPELPATTLTPYCYDSMFSGCGSLTTAPELPATTLAPHCYNQMFSGCNSLTTASELPATTLTQNCYSNMFAGCSSLTTAPELPATTLATSCYNSMFFNCSSLTTAPDLLATTLATSCYNQMFSGCNSLTTAPELPAVTLATGCYKSMFFGCSSLNTAPKLPATTLAPYCYNQMFSGCNSLTTASELPATTLTRNCYASMFNSCSALNYVRCYFTDWGESSCTNSWLSGVSSTGNFYGPLRLDMSVRDNSHIPSGWAARYNVVKKVELTQAEYDNLYDNKQLDPDTIYIITT